MTDLYKTLGIRKNASAKTIKNAYRKRAMETHPDRQGDPVEFQAVQLAWEVLSDPERRARYDATGETAPEKAVNEYAELMNTLGPALLAIVNGILDAGQKPERIDLVGKLTAEFTALLKTMNEAKAKFIHRAAEWANVAGRISANGVENVLALSARHYIETLNKAIADQDTQIGRATRALEFLAKCKFNVELFQTAKSGIWTEIPVKEVNMPGGATLSGARVFWRKGGEGHET